MSKEEIKSTARTAGLMIAGAIIVMIGAFITWSIINFDVLTKAVKYPEAVRQMKIEIRVAQIENEK